MGFLSEGDVIAVLIDSKRPMSALEITDALGLDRVHTGAVSVCVRHMDCVQRAGSGGHGPLWVLRPRYRRKTRGSRLRAETARERLVS